MRNGQLIDPPPTLRVAALADIHCRATAAGSFQDLFSQISERADVLLICGDLTDRGLPEEGQVLAKEIRAALKVPVVAVLGNHDYESSRQEELRAVLCEAGIEVLDGEAHEVAGVGFAGVAGFIGGFGARTLQPWGEETIKRVVHQTVEEALKLESALAKLRTPQRLVLLHYSPVRSTLEGEPPEIYPFLGSSRLEEPLSRFPVAAVFHGHAHAGSPEGRTARDVPVYNVAIPVLARYYPGRSPFRVIEVPRHFEPARTNGSHPEREEAYTVLKDTDR